MIFQLSAVARVVKPQLIMATLLLGGALNVSAQEAKLFPKGERTYQKTCALCHEADVGPTLLGRNLPPEYITAVVRHGFKAMPAFPQSHLDEATLKELGSYIQQTTLVAEETQP